MDKLNDVISGASLALAAYGIKEAAESVAELAKASETLDVDAQRLQAWGQAARSVGMQTSRLSDAIRDLRQRTGEAIFDPGSEPGQAFRRLGLDPNQLAKSDNLLGDLAKKLALIRDPSMRIDIMDQLGGDAFTEMIPLLTQNLDELYATLEKRGLLLNDEEIATLVEATQVIRDLTGAFVMIGQKVSARLFDGIKVAVEGISSVIDRMEGSAKSLYQTLDSFGLLDLATGVQGLIDPSHMQKADGVYHGPAGGALAQSAALRQGTTGETNPYLYRPGIGGADKPIFGPNPDAIIQENQAARRRRNEDQRLLELQGFATDWDQ